MAEVTRLCPVCRTIMKSAAYKVGKQDGTERLEIRFLHLMVLVLLENF